MADRYDQMTDEQIREAARRRGIPSYKTDLFVGNALQQYMRDFDYDEQEIARWEQAGGDW